MGCLRTPLENGPSEKVYDALTIVTDIMTRLIVPELVAP